MTRYSASRGIVYTAPPAADEDAETDPGAAEAESEDRTPADD